MPVGPWLVRMRWTGECYARAGSGCAAPVVATPAAVPPVPPLLPKHSPGQGVSAAREHPFGAAARLAVRPSAKISGCSGGGRAWACRQRRPAHVVNPDIASSACEAGPACSPDRSDLRLCTWTALASQNRRRLLTAHRRPKSASTAAGVACSHRPELAGRLPVVGSTAGDQVRSDCGWLSCPVDPGSLSVVLGGWSKATSMVWKPLLRSAWACSV